MAGWAKFAIPLSIFFGLTVSLAYPTYVPLTWTVTMLSTAVAYGLLSPVISAKKILFLGGSTPHTALLAISLGFIFSAYLGGPVLSWSVVIGVFLIYIIGYLIYRGFEPDRATAIYVGTAASLSVLSLYYIATHFSMYTSISSIIIGDPLLAGKSGALVSLTIASIMTLFLITSYDELVYIGIDSEYARLAGLRVRYYDLAFYTLLGLASVSLLRIIGYILTHVYILLPGAIGAAVSKGSREALYNSVAVSMTSSLIGLYAAVALDLSPAGTTGVILALSYVFLTLARRR